jgi:hypothetical protein
MIDISGPKVLVPTALFALLSPGLLVTVGQKGMQALFIHAAVLAIVYYLVARFFFKMTLTQADLVVPAVLFVLLTPGTLLTLPPHAQGALPVGVHALVFAVVFSLLRSYFPKYY